MNTAPRAATRLLPAQTMRKCYYCYMIDGDGELRALATGQFGLFTAAQARARGVERYELARATNRQVLRRVHHGVYAFVDSDLWWSYQEWAAQWLALRPAADVASRRAAPDAIVSHHSAAEMRNLGTIVAHGLDLTAPHRINVRDGDTHSYRKPVGTRGVDWDLVDGLPVATPARIISDLTEAVIDGSHLGTVINDCVRDHLLSEARIAQLCSPHAHRWGLPRGEGAALVQVLRSAATESVGI